MLHLVFEGPDGSGKSTMAAMLAAELKKAGADVHTLHQPGCNKVASQIRKVFKGQWGKPCKMAQFHLAVADHCEYIYELEKIRQLDISQPDKVHVLIQDRHSGVSGWAYQVVGSGVDASTWKQVYCSPSMQPLHTPDYIFLYLPTINTVLKRIAKRGEKRDHFEQTEFLKRVIKGYYQVPHEGPFSKDKYIISSAKGSIEAEYKKVISDLHDALVDSAETPDKQALRELTGKLNIAYNLGYRHELPKIKVAKK